MPFTIERLRRWVLAAAALLIVVVLSFLFYGRYRFRHIARDLPARLGVNIQQTATGFSYSQSSQGHTLFTLKASKEFQLKSGHVLLHNVDITLYGPPGSNRTDHIDGSDFDYDQQQGTAVSRGPIQIELAGMASPSSSPGSVNAAVKAPSGQNTVRVQTSGLTFFQKTGEATTSQPVHFQLPRASGSSIGADYNSKTGVLMLSSQVHIATSTAGSSALISAAHATVLRDQQKALLTMATLAWRGENASADQATVRYRKDGTAQTIDAQGHVHLATPSGATASSQSAHILFNLKSQPTQADLAGGVLFDSAHGSASMHGASEQATLTFVPAGTQTELRHAEFRRNVTFVDQITGLTHDPHGRAERHLRADTLDVAFAPTAPGQPLLARTAVANGSPLLTLLQLPGKGPRQTTRIAASQLVATLGPNNALQKLDGAGNTQLFSESSDGAHSTSRGDILHVTFLQRPIEASAAKSAAMKAKGKSAPPPTQTALETALQDGHVTFSETPAHSPGATTQPQTLTGSAQHAEYHADSQLLVLTGNPRIHQGVSTDVAADRIVYHRDMQDAVADGHVKAAYAQLPSGTKPSPTPSMGGSGPVFVIADHAAMLHATGQNFFYGTDAAPARMWQGLNSLTAPLIELDRAHDVLKASAPNALTPLVDAVFVSTSGVNHQPTLVRVHSDTLVYSDKNRQADFRGSVAAVSGDQNLHADDALVFLKPAPPRTPAKPASGAAPAHPSSQIDHVIATGHVVFTQPGRHGEGAKLVYTADDGRYVLTGSPGAPPRITDRVHGTTTGATLTFNAQNDSVIVSGGHSSAITETHAPR